MKSPAVEFDTLHLSVGHTELLKSLSFRIEEGERVALIGRSGSGKSLCAGLMHGATGPAQRKRGSVRLFGQELRFSAREDRTALTRVSSMSQDSFTALNPLVRVGRQLAKALGAPSGNDPQVLKLLEQVGFEDPSSVARCYSGTLSGGQRQRICLAMALAQRADLLILDEPTTALDLVTQASILRLIDQTVTELGATLVFITHDLPVAAQLCDRAIELRHGTVHTQRSLALPEAAHPHALAASA
ncbi:dipeptide/oligopeptide/nickel ABC transporter ATP-binding protein [Glutamicibacter sp. PS]|uniref:ABC transporter ATP-binding protein n=1 Tax=Glutamicibacter sp. PS TaxID=3075634 RepID=UPI00283E412F|nr:dipeptide/oligopeptide/nickel ABC transporter ATP-binding protein [Glutamicibacter sp. PS]MDR4534505.1 dipeptide/oligopeptide/nickel ABC transporter ATP-binding protein [Glutamicibacter sp. PS]